MYETLTLDVVYTIAHPSNQRGYEVSQLGGGFHRVSTPHVFCILNTLFSVPHKLQGLDSGHPCVC